MKLLVAILAVLALVGSAMAWELTDQLTYTYTKSAYQQAGAGLVTDAMTGATSNAHFYDPVVQVSGIDVIPKSAATVSNTLGTVTVDRSIAWPVQNLANADFTATLTQGGSANVALHSQINDAAAAEKYKLTGVKDTPEMMGTASAYQNLALAGGFDEASTSFNSAATVGVDSIWAKTFTTSSTYNGGTLTGGATLSPNSASVSSGAHGGGVIESANLGESVTADVVKSWPGTGWATPEYSGGINMWANFVACDPLCTNPIVATVSGSSWTGMFPGDTTLGNYGGNTGTGYWTGGAQTTNPFS
jgi:hypothetical protein